MNKKIAKCHRKIVTFFKVRRRFAHFYFSKPLSMKSYLYWSNAFFFLFSTVVGMLIGSNDSLKRYFSEKYFYSISLSILYFVIHLVIEIGAVRKLSDNVRGIWIRGNPMLKVILFQTLFTVLAGWFVLTGFVLNDVWSYFVLSLLSAGFVGSVFQSFRFIRGKSLTH